MTLTSRRPCLFKLTNITKRLLYWSYCSRQELAWNQTNSSDVPLPLPTYVTSDKSLNLYPSFLIYKNQNNGITIEFNLVKRVFNELIYKNYLEQCSTYSKCSSIIYDYHTFCLSIKFVLLVSHFRVSTSLSSKNQCKMAHPQLRINLIGMKEKN